MKHTSKGSVFTDIVLEVFKLNGLLVSDGDQLVSELGLTSARWKVLGALAKGSRRMTVSEIAREMGQSRQAVQRLANEMLDAELLVALDNPGHRRAKLFDLSERGKKAYSQAMRRQTPWANSIAKNVKESDLKTALSTLRAISTSLNSS